MEVGPFKLTTLTSVLLTSCLGMAQATKDKAVIQATMILLKRFIFPLFLSEIIS